MQLPKSRQLRVVDHHLELLRRVRDTIENNPVAIRELLDWLKSWESPPENPPP